jgi:hypothetical protein
MTLDQVNRISPEIAKLFKGGAWLTALEYEGSMSALTNDFIIHAWAFPLSHIIHATNVTLILGFLGAGMAMVAYASFGILMKRKYVVPPKNAQLNERLRTLSFNLCLCCRISLVRLLWCRLRLVRF